MKPSGLFLIKFEYQFLFFRISLSLIFLLVTSFLFGQHQPIFQESSNTDLTRHFMESGDKKDELMAEKFSKLHRKEGFVISDVMYNGTLFTKNLSRSGAINFNSQATRYLNEIKDHLLKDYPEAREEINIYITYSPVLNAFATVDKNVYVNIGLLARLDNEAQLAYILSHEIMHVINYHIIEKKRAENKEIQSLGKGDIALENDIEELSQHQMSLNHEFEADMDGLNLYLRSDYAEEQAVTALELLRSANKSIYSYESSPSLIYMSDSLYFNQLDSLREEPRKEEGVTKGSTESTHPDIEERIDTITVSIESLRDENKGEMKFVVSEDLFDRLKAASLSSCSDMYKRNFDFVSTFKNANYRIQEGEDDEILYNEIGYALFGLIVDKMNKVELGIYQNVMEVDSVLSYFYNTSSSYELTKWTFDVIDTLTNAENKEILERYKINIANAVFKHAKQDSLIELVKPISNKGVMNQELRLADVDFEIGARSDISPDQRRTFNEQEVFSEKTKGKIAFFNIMNFNLKRKGFVAVTNLRKMERMNDRSASALFNLEEDYPKDMISIVPNQQDYQGEEYAKYQLLNSWLRERLYFEGYDYVSLYEDQIQELIKEEGIEYAMTSLRIEIRSFSFGKFLSYYLGVIITPHYVPGMAAAIAVGSSRNYALTLIFKLKDGSLALWDKRTSLEPQTSAQIYATYQEILSNLKTK